MAPRAGVGAATAAAKAAARRSLYAPQMEKDACGVALLAHLKAQPSHAIVRDALVVLARMEHRGGCGCDPNTGDGSGILMAMPDAFMRRTAAQAGVAKSLPALGEYASGLVFASHDAAARETQQRALADAAKEMGLEVLGWRRPPTDNSPLGGAAVASEPFILQVFVASPTKRLSSDELERALYLVRKRAAAKLDANTRADFYIASLSSRTITYKGQLTSYQLPMYYRDLNSADMASHCAMVHSRFSTNTFPSWDRAQPNRLLCHNGEINTLRGNKNWMAARMAAMRVPFMERQGRATAELAPFTSDDKTDSGNLDAVLELLVRGSEERSLPEAMLMMVPEAWQSAPASQLATPEGRAKKAFYEFHANMMEPWDGPAMMAFTDGRFLGAVLDRNGLRPARYCVTKDDRVLLSSEVGVLPEIDPANVKIKARLEPGRMFLVDFQRGDIVLDEELKTSIAKARPYEEWVAKGSTKLGDWARSAAATATASAPPPQRDLTRDLHSFGYTTETMDILLTPMASTGKEALGSMGIDIPLAVLSEKPQLPFNYFKQLFAQVTNPPIDPIREEIVMSLECPVGPEANVFAPPSPAHAQRLVVEHPVLTDAEMAAVKAANTKERAFNGRWVSRVVDATMPVSNASGAALASAIDTAARAAADAVRGGANVVVLSHEAVGPDRIPIPSLLVTGATHHHLIREGLRTATALFVQAGDAREVHDFCTLMGFGADGVHPFVAYRAVESLARDNKLGTYKGKPVSPELAVDNYRHAAGKGMLKVMAKMGISTLQSYKGAQIFECVGLDDDVVRKCFPGTASRIAGAGFDALAGDVVKMHAGAQWPGASSGLKSPILPNPGEYHYRDGGEEHYNSPAGMALLQAATRMPNATTSSSGREAYKKYAEETHRAASRVTLRGLLDLDTKNSQPVPLEEVEPAADIVKRFCTGAMSLGSISAEAHEALAVAMNSMGAKSNTGEGGEDPKRFTWRGPHGESKRSAIKQVASGRFGVTSHYLANADQIQIKMAQGAKPGEGGELPGYKVTVEIARVRGTTPGVGLISPPPHHDSYSIEDLAQLIHDLKSANPDADVSVKLVSEVGVGVVAAGCVKAKAGHVTISGGDGGTGAAAWTGVHKAGLPWELGLAETQQTLVLNDLRSRVRLQTDGQIKSGRDVVVAALLGAEEMAFSTTPLVALGCIMMRKCHLNTCPVGIATQDPVLRAKFAGQPEHVVNFLFLLAEEVREYMAALGFRTFEEMVGRADKLVVADASDARWHAKSRGLALEHLLYPSAKLNEKAGRVRTKSQDHKLDEALDNQLISRARAALERGDSVAMELPVSNLDRSVGATLSYHVSKRYGAEGLPPGTIQVRLRGSAGQSLGFALARGVEIDVEGEANDYVGKALSGGRVVVRPPRELLEKHAGFVPEDNVIVGNVVLYGATSGDGYFRGRAGERFCVRNSGAKAVVEGCGDHGCEYMTGGRVVVLGKTGRNFAAGMSGGVAFVLDRDGSFAERCNPDMVSVEPASGAREELQTELREMVETHLRVTGSTVARDLLMDWDANVSKFVMVMPHDYRAVMEKKWRAEDAAVAAAASSSKRRGSAPAAAASASVSAA